MIGVNGWVRNKGEEVEVLLQGNEDKINKMIGILKKGPHLSRVDDVEISYQEPKEILEGFEIRR